MELHNQPLETHNVSLSTCAVSQLQWPELNRLILNFSNELDLNSICKKEKPLATCIKHIMYVYKYQTERVVEINTYTMSLKVLGHHNPSNSFGASWYKIYNL